MKKPSKCSRFDGILRKSAICIRKQVPWVATCPPSLEGFKLGLVCPLVGSGRHRRVILKSRYPNLV